jgi:outer membrane cobalamin receptor
VGEKPGQKVRPHDVVVVTASREQETVGDASAYVTVVPAEQLWLAPSLTLDDALRQVPGFSLFRRGSSLTAHPTTLGVSLRGVGPSGAGRSLVLFDGIPLNDPFGGWVYWNRLPRLSLAQLEVVRGSGSQLYGSSALGGTIQLLTRRPEQTALRLLATAGSDQTLDLEASAEGVSRGLAYLVAGRIFDTQGSWSLDPGVRGQVDRRLEHRFGSLLGRVYAGDWRFGVNFYADDRNNGTELQTNASKLALLEGGIRKPGWRADFYLQEGVLDSRFSRVSADRSQEFLTADQHVTTSALGASLTFKPATDLVVGSDWRRAGWDGFDQNLWGAFFQQRASLGEELEFQAGLRLDLWENQETRWSLNPRLGMVWKAADEARIRVSVYRGFRAPTLNELYRPFRVGNVLTLENPGLGAESLLGFESGMDLFPGSTWMLRVNTFWNRLDHPVGNVTISAGGGQILRRRENLGPVDVAGIEAEATWLGGERWEIGLAWLASRSRVRATGRQFPQAPVHQAAGWWRFRGPVVVRAEIRMVSSQFEDDLNQYRLGGFGLLDCRVSRPLGGRLELFAAAENLLDHRYVTARLPEERLGESRKIYGGIAYGLGQR